MTELIASLGRALCWGLANGKKTMIVRLDVLQALFKERDMGATIQMSFQDALSLIKKSLELGKVQNAIELIDSLINQLNAMSTHVGQTECNAQDVETPSTPQETV